MTHPGLGKHADFWQDVKCGQLVEKQNVISIDSDLPVETGAEILVKHGISSAPVIEKSTGKCFGMFDYQDLVSYILVVFKKQQWKEDEENVEIGEIIRRALNSEPVSVKLVADLSQRNPFFTISSDATLLEAMEIFGKDIHRVAVTDQATGNIIGILTQSNVAHFLYSKLNDIPNAQKTIKELGISKAKVLSINAEAQVFDAMALMHDNGLTSLPMVDHSNHLQGSISMSDIKYVLRGFKYNMLWRSAFQFIAHVRNHQGLVEDAGRDRYPVFDVKEHDTLARAMGKMGATKSHRVWIVSEANKLTGVVSLTDALAALTPKQ